MRVVLEGNDFDTRLEPSDWRYSAAIVGLIQYFEFHSIKYEAKGEWIDYKSEEITEEKYLKFIENKYGEEFHHIVIENILSKEEISDEEVKLVNEKSNANVIMKNVFNKLKFDNTNKDEILKLINENREVLIKETFRRKSNMYANFSNTNQLFNEGQQYCRLVGYCIDAGKKGKSTGFGFNTNTFVSDDCIEFDFIPFAFEGERESFFINDNFTIKTLESSYQYFKRIVNDPENNKEKAREALFKGIMESSDFLGRDVEVIYKNRENSFFETLYLRKENIDIFKALKEREFDYKAICTSIKITKDYYINIQKEVTKNILNNLVMDDLIEVSLKEKRGYLVNQLIKINVLIRGENMKDNLKGAYRCAKLVSEKLETNKIDSYRNKLTSSIIFKDYDRVCQVLLQLSNYSGVEFGFVYDLFDDFESNKDLAYTFINALSKNKQNND